MKIFFVKGLALTSAFTNCYDLECLRNFSLLISESSPSCSIRLRPVVRYIYHHYQTMSGQREGITSELSGDIEGIAHPDGFGSTHNSPHSCCPT